MNIECKYCKKTYDIPITEEDYQKWLSTPSGDVRMLLTILKRGNVRCSYLRLVTIAGSACLEKAIVRYITHEFIYKIK